MSRVDDDTPDADELDTDQGEESEGTTPTQDDPDAATGTGKTKDKDEQGSDKDTPAAPEKVLEKRYKDLQGAFTRTTQENAEMRRRLEALEGKGKESAPAPATDEEFSEEKFDEIAEKEGRGKALRYMHNCAVKTAQRGMSEVLTQRERQQRTEAEAREMLSELEYQEAEIQQLSQLGEREREAGFAPSPGALFVLKEADGDYRKAIKLIRAGKKALEAEQAASAEADEEEPEVEQPKPAAKAPPMPGSGTQRAPRTAKRDGQVALSALGIR